MTLLALGTLEAKANADSICSVWPLPKAKKAEEEKKEKKAEEAVKIL